MNQEAQMYWDKYWKGQKTTKSVNAWKFGGDSEYLAQLVVDGIKTATCSGHIFYELKNEPLPTTENYGIVLDSEDKPMAIIKTTEVTLTPMNEVTEEFAVAEGDGTYQNWWKIHEEFFRDKLNAIGLEFSEDILLVCERFEVIDIKVG
ncbi:ASCH domain-containing protein [Sporosarcina psychrophila]|uniref:ASCH domain-containing protein n=1 Tax=Sporosarcina psychrophila TaxID=1476 RepID=UPI0030D528C8